MKDGPATLLDPEFLLRLERLRIQARRAFPGIMRGERRSTRRGSSVEFSDFRKYEAGDDFRHVDWSIYARLDRLMLRQFIEEEDIRIDILIDGSASMRFGAPVEKFDFARRAAAALAFLGLYSLDRVGIMTFDASIRARCRPLRGRGCLHALLTFLDGIGGSDGATPRPLRGGPINPVDQGGERPVISPRSPKPEKATDLRAVLGSYQQLNPRPGIVFVISDFFDRTDFRKEMRLLVRRGYSLNLIQTLAPEELNPDIIGDLLLVDSETGETRELTANARVVDAYRKALDSLTNGLQMFSRSAGIAYTMLRTDADFEDALLRNLIQTRMAE